MTKFLQIDGFTEHSGDWELAGDIEKAAGWPVTERECEQNGDANSVTAADITNATTLGVYSFGWSSLQDETAGGAKIPAGKVFDDLYIVAGVADWAFGQFSLATPPTYSNRIFCFVHPMAIPASQFLTGLPKFSITDPDLLAKLKAAGKANIDCSDLYHVGTFDIAGRINVHTHMQNHPVVIATIMQLMGAQ